MCGGCGWAVAGGVSCGEPAVGLELREKALVVFVEMADVGDAV